MKTVDLIILGCYVVLMGSGVSQAGDVECDLGTWNLDILSTWPPAFPLPPEVILDNGNWVIGLQAGSRDGGGNHALLRTDWNGDHYRVQGRVKFVGSGTGAHGGVVGRYTPLTGGHPGCPSNCPACNACPSGCSQECIDPEIPIGGTGYVAYMINQQPGQIALIRLDGMDHVQSNYCYGTCVEHLATVTATFEPARHLVPA